MSSLDAYIISYNCGRELIKPAIFAPHILQAATGRPDLIVFCLQEVAPISYAFLGGSFLSPYLDAFGTALQLVDDDYVNVVTHNIGLTAIMVFAKESISSHIESLELAATGVGFQETGHKGAAGVRMSYEDVTLTFVSAHLAAGEEALERRNQDYQAIVERLVFDAASKDSQSSQQGERAHLVPREKGMYASSHIIFAGDLNYRTSSQPPTEEDARQFPQPTRDPEDPQHWSHLFQHDQLTEQVRSKKTLQHLSESTVDFPPTYKYKSSDDVLLDGEKPWPWASHRWPSWCDRIFYSAGVDPQAYEALPLFGTSDHRPVALSASIPLKSSAVAASPYGLDPQWQTKRAAARRKELAVGTITYLTWTKEGATLLLASVVGVLGFGFILRSILV
ncbi:Inositol-1,4,5-trisphosphate 5-phosphatase 1 [Cyphellophora attinorum]|uniref:Inositol-1,4,5-trisphosphate 5-phosphatase 1 n=1 Tax=Cyphellophora attinorum TaxID=1664694 RepID=A0A0N1NX14_9EURO|nr:Inositol-1,4,5-trisphosphate 5-phosphatase 1 [Phialophora attinorum]KPI36912.1 Inositol-1,4,5-trisphosphate 5-phosphatase 1 [Phialophora attinorum]